MPGRQFELAFSAVNGSFTKRNRKTDGCIQQKVIVGVVVEVAAEIVRVELELSGERLGRAEFVIVAARRFHWQTEHVLVQTCHGGRTGKKDVLKRGSLKRPIV